MTGSTKEIVGAMVWTGTYYSPDYVSALANGMRRFAGIDRVFCLVDNAGRKLLPDGVEPIVIEPEFVQEMGWWGKAALFSKMMPRDVRVFYSDLDNVIVAPVKNIMRCIQIKKPSQVIACEDAIHWLGERFSSTVMGFDTGEHEYVYDRLLSDIKKYGRRNFESRRGGDQVWLAPLIRDHIMYVEDIADGRYANNYKFDLSKVGPTPETEIVCFSGHPKPEHVFKKHEWVREFWRP